MADEKEVQRIQKMLDECDLESESSDDSKEDSEEESDHVEEDTRISDDESYESDSDDAQQEPCPKQPKLSGWVGKDNETLWMKEIPNRSVRHRLHNVFRGGAGPKGQALNVNTPTEFWELFFTREIVNLLVEETNKYINKKYEDCAQDHITGCTDVIEIKAFLGLLYLAGLFHSNRMNLKDLWNNDGTGIEIFRLTMTLHRFRFLICCLRFDDISTRPERRELDKLAPIRDLFEMFVENCLKNYSPTEFVTIDEMLVAFQGRCPFRQYIPNKPAKYGIKIQAMADAKTYYVSKMEIYGGKQPKGPFAIDNSALAVVTRLTKEISGSGRNVTIDNWYTSYPLLKNLITDHKLSMVGTVRKNKRELPKEFLPMKDRTKCDSMFGFTNIATLVSYIGASKKKKNVLLLSSMHYDANIDPNSGDKKKPDIITFYNSTKGGVDMVDQMAGEYDVSRNSRRWPMTVFYTLLNVANINSYVLYCYNPQNNLKRRLFIKTVGLKLLEDQWKRRMTNCHVKKDIREGIKRILPTNESTETPTRPYVSRGRCAFCKRSRDRKVKTVCKKCGQLVCKDHSEVVVLCFECNNKSDNELE